MPRTMKPFHLYDLDDYRRSQKTGEYIYAIGTTYAKTIRGAMKTFIENHIGDFIVESNGIAQVVSLY